jgi:hypothetical protein
MGRRDERKNIPASAIPAPGSEGILKWPQVTTDYHGAVARLMTMRADKKRYLLFGYVELFPRDIPLPMSFAPAQRPWTVPGSGGDITLASSARRMSVADALAWYEDASRGRVTIPPDTSRSDKGLNSGEGKTTSVDLASPPFGTEPTFGRFCVGENVPFAAQWHGGPRIHRLVPMENLAEPVQNLAASADARKWLADNGGFDPFQFEEWLGSLSLLAPDPLLEGVGHFAQERRADGSERIVIQAHRRRYSGYPEADADALSLVLLQRRPGGWTEVLPTSFDDDGFAITDYPEPVSETGYAISCPIRGLLRMVPPTLWMGQINIGFSVTDAIVDVEVPKGGRRKPASRYKTYRVNDTGGVQVGEALPPSGAIRIVELQEAHKRRVHMESAPQRLFGAHESDKDDLTEEDLMRKRAEAERYVAGLVAGAQHRVIFVDPDFGLREMQNYALRVMRDSVDVKVLTSAHHLRRTADEAACETAIEEPEAGAPSATLGARLLNQLRHVQSQLGRGAPKVLVMPGSKKPLFHDRFVVIDDTVWASGPSFNELGERIGLISRVHEPRSVIAAIERALCRSQSLADWVAQAELQDQPNGGADATNI